MIKNKEEIIMKVKSLVAGACIAALALTSAVFAQETVLISEAPAEKSIYVNDVKIDAVYMEAADGTAMIPVRKVCETLGFNVVWNAETNDVVVEKIPMYFTFNVYQDGYTLARTAPILLGKAPVVENCTTYVPLNFVTDIMSFVAKFENGRVDIKSSTEEAPEHTVVFKGEADGMCVVYDMLLGDVLVNISENTVLSDAVEAWEEGQLISVVYDDFMSASIPPMTNAVKMTNLNSGTAEIVTGTVTEVINEDGLSRIAVTDANGNITEYNVAEETDLISLDGDQAVLDDFVKDTKVNVMASMASTMSIPPQRAAYAVRITE